MPGGKVSGLNQAARSREHEFETKGRHSDAGALPEENRARSTPRPRPPGDHSQATAVMGGELSEALRASWLPKITKGWFFRAETFFSVARYLDAVGSESDFLSHSHGEGFMRFFEERCQRQGIFIFDEPESALSPARQMEFLKLMRRMEQSTICQIVMATHSPMLMAYPNARLLRLSKYGLEPVTIEATDHYKVMREFCADPAGFVEAVIEE